MQRVLGRTVGFLLTLAMLLGPGLSLAPAGSVRASGWRLTEGAVQLGLAAADVKPLAEPAVLAFPQQCAAKGTFASVALTLTLPGEAIYSLDLHLTWDPAVADLISVEKTPLTEDWLLCSNQLQPGQVSVAAAGLEALADSGAVLSFVFQVSGSAGAGTDLTMTSVALNEGSVPANLQHGYLRATVGEAGGESALPLDAGWNLISLPLSPTATNLPDAMASIAGYYDAVWAYQGDAAAEPWLQYHPDAPAFASDTLAIGEAIGLWVHTRAAVILTIEGTPWTTDEILLQQGWNLVGYPSQCPAPVAVALATIQGKYDLVMTQEEGEPASLWTRYEPSAAPALNTLTEIEPGRGYWLRATEDCVWRLG